MTLFWHGLFATGFNKCDDPRVITKQINMFRRHGLGSFRELLVELSRDPAMIYWLDNNQSRGDAPNENYGRELLELGRPGRGTVRKSSTLSSNSLLPPDSLPGTCTTSLWLTSHRCQPGPPSHPVIPRRLMSWWMPT